MASGPESSDLYLNPGRYVDEVPAAHFVDEAVLEMVASDREEAEGRALEAEAEVERLRALLARCVGETTADEQERMAVLDV